MQPLHFLIVDDDAINNLLCQLIIEQQYPHAIVETFTDPELALQHISHQTIDALNMKTTIFLDINMPVISGWDFLKQYAGFGNTVKSHTQIYMLSSSVDPRDKQAAAENMYVQGYLEKPLSAEQLVHVLQAA